MSESSDSQFLGRGGISSSFTFRLLGVVAVLLWLHVRRLPLLGGLGLVHASVGGKGDDHARHVVTARAIARRVWSQAVVKKLWGKEQIEKKR